MRARKLDHAYTRSVEHYMKHGEAGLMEVIRAQPGRGAADGAALADRENKLREAER